MVAALLLTMHFMPPWAEDGMLLRLLRLAGLVLVGVLAYFGVLLILPFVWHRLVVPSSGAVAALLVALLISAGILTWAGFNDPQEVNGTLSADATPAEPISQVADQEKQP